ncbi:hypothetical protein H6P81_005870 [Aristolochia fimbriata]|uniref:Uncharacterized protein n=1 Tax=Aristolochia fimbriata TaxID=158543 RepID=A0AAV7EYH6_ARIFI|nr:hypothetical protein H6P81_005870 [Aristolochia fimbriata]
MRLRESLLPHPHSQEKVTVINRFESLGMSSENEDQCFTWSPAGSKSPPHKLTKISYTRDFLLSFSDLDICKSLPAGFDKSVLSEFEDTSHNIPEWQRVPGGLSSQNSKRSEDGTSPPNNYSRGNQGRWDTRSSGSNDRDGDFQSDRESDVGRRYGNQSRRSWQTPEHDGLLGSGAFPRPSGYSSGGTIAPRGRGNGHYPLNRSTEPYQPPRPYKAMPHIRRDNTDILNDETFGSSECSSEDRAEEERKRRASFELMRKEQQKVLQEKQKHGAEKHKDQIGMDIGVLMESSEAEKVLWNCNLNKSEDSHVEPGFDDESVKCSMPAQAPAARPLIPPGFASTMLEKNVGAKLLAPLQASEVGNSELEDDISQSKSIWMAQGLCDNQDSRKSSTICEDTSETNVLPSLDVVVSDYSISIENPHSNFVSNQREASVVWPNSPMTNLGAEKSAVGVSGLTPGEGKSVLQKLFDSALTLNGVGSLSSAEHPAVILNEDPWDPVSSSKFARWFLDEEPINADDHPSSKSRELLSLISDKGRHQVSKASDETAVEHLPPSVLFEKAPVSPTTVKSEKNVTSEANLTVLTCEDLEQVIMAEASESGTQNLVQAGSWDVSEAELEPPKAEVDNHASKHLLSLLQKGSEQKKLALPSSFDAHTTDDKGTTMDKVEEIHSDEKNITLETLFGSAFMKELQSVGAPVSSQRGTTAMGITVDDSNHGINLIGLNHNDTKSDVFQGDWLGFNNPRADSSNLSAVGFEERVDGPMELQLPEEDSLITMGGDAVQLVTSKTQDCLSSNAPVEIVDKLATLNAIMKGERSMLPGMDSGPVFHDAYDPVNSELPFQHSHGRPSSPSFSHHQINHHNTRPFFQSVDQHAHRNPQMIGPENIPHQDFSHFSSNAFHHPHSFNGPGGPRFDPHHHPVMPHMRSLQGNFPPSHMLQGLPRGVPLSPPMGNMGGYITQDLGPLQGFALNHRQPNFSGTGMMAPGQINHPESRERLEMDLRANTKQQIFPVGTGQAPGMYVPTELDMGFRYR